MAVTLDMMEYATDILAQVAYLSSDFDPASWDLLDEDCAGIGDWVDGDTGDAVSRVNPAGQFEFDSRNSAAGDNYALRHRDIGSYPNTFTVEIKLYHDAIGTQADEDSFALECYQVDQNIRIYFCSDGLFIYDTGSGFTEVGTDLVKHGGSAEWQTWRFVVTFTDVAGEGTCDVYLYDSTHDWEKVGTAIPCSREQASTEGLTRLIQHGYANNNRITHIDYLKIVTGLQPPNLQCFSEAAIKQQGSYSLKVQALTTGSLNDTLTRTISPTIDLTGYSKIKFDVRASRTGSNLKLRIRDLGGTWSEYTIAISVANTWEAKEWDISGVSDANKDAIDRIEFKIIEASADNTFYLDNMAGWTPTLTFIESIGLLESLPTIERQLTLEEAIALKESIDTPACPDVVLTEALALAESFEASEQTIVRITATAEFLAEQAKRTNTPAKRIWLYINSSLYDITDKLMSMGPIDRKMTYKPGETKLLTISDQNLVMSNADKYFSDLNSSSPFYNRAYVGADTIKVFAGFIIPLTGYTEVLQKADMKLIAIELATKEGKAFLTCQDSLRDVFDIYVGMPTSEGVSDPLIYENKSFKYIMDDLLINKAGIAAAKVDIEDVDLTFISISFEKKKVAECVEKLSEVARGTTIVLGDGTVKFEQFISESIDPELSLKSGENFSTLKYLGSDSRYRTKKVVVIGQAGVYGESTDTEGIELKIENDAIEDSDIAQAMADIYLGKFRIVPAKIELRGEYLPSLDLKSIVEVTEPNSMMSNELLQVKELALDIVGFLTQLTLSIPGRFVGWTNTGGGDHKGGDWIIASDVEVGGVHTNIGAFKVNAGVTATVKGYDGSTHGSFEVHAVDVDVDGAIVASEKGCGGGGAGGGGGGGRYYYGVEGSGGGGGSGVAGGENGENGNPGYWTGSEERGGNGGNGGNGGGGTGAGIKGSGGIGAKGDVGVDHVPATAGGAASNGGYGTVPNDNNDVSVDESLLRGKGGGAGGGGGGGDGEVIDSATASGAGGGGGGAGGYGAGWIKLYATTSIDISGNLEAKGNSGGNGGNGDNGQSGTHPGNLNGGNGGAGGNAATAGTRLKGSGGTARWSTQNGANGGNGGHGAGGGLLLKCAVADAILVAGTLDNRGGGDATTNGGTIKVFYSGVDPTGAGTWHYGRLYKEDIS